MARPREFDRNEALDQAMQLFWSRGYEATSMADLTRAMGLSKSSLYDSFGSKHELFLTTIDHYNETVASRRLAALIKESGGGLAGITAVFDAFVENLSSDGEARGCFVCNAAIEVAAHDRAASARVCAGMSCLEAAFREAIVQGQAAGEIGNANNARSLARYLNAALNGILVMGKAGRDRAALADVARLTLEVLE
ncbi:MAG: TetR/AcrR family transcriptional regulator [Alphaproteobacteria bacterium]